MYAVIGMNSKIGDWARVEGTPNDPNPNKPFAKTDNNPLFNQEGKLNPSITIVGKYFFLRVSFGGGFERMDIKNRNDSLMRNAIQ